MNDLISYISTGKKDRIITFVFGIVFFAVGAVIKLNGSGTSSTVLMIAMLLCGLALMYFTFTSKAEQKKQIEAMKMNGLLARAAEEFPSAEVYAADTLRLGQNFIFRRKQAEILQYTDIAEVSGYDRVGMDNSGPEFSIMLKLKDGHSCPLCSVYGVGGALKVQEIINIINARKGSQFIS